MPLLYIAIGVAVLILLMVVFRLNAFLSLILVSILVGVMEGMSPVKAITAIQTGLGSTLGNLALVLGFGAMLGKLMADSGAAQRIATTMIQLFGRNKVQWAVVLTGFIVGIALFYETGVVILVPLVFSIAIAARLPVLYLGIPVATALITAHGFLPPHPGPTAVAGVFHASIGKTLLYGIILAIPAVILAGPLYTKLFKKESLETDIPKGLFQTKQFSEEEMPGFAVSIITAIIPVVLMAFQAFLEIFFPQSALLPFANFVGNPAIAILIAVLLAIFTFGIAKGRKMNDVMKTITDSIASISMILLIIGAGGAFKQVLIDSGVEQYIAQLMEGSTLSPLLLTWMVATILKLSVGSATVAGITAAGITAPLVSLTGVSPELMVLATGAGSLTFSHVNDAGFWIFKEYFNLSIGKTIRTWSILNTIISLVGLVGVLLIHYFIA